MSFPIARSRNAIYAPLPPSPPPKTITAAEHDRRLSQLREMKDFINSQACPLCGAQLDGSIAYNQATVYCRAAGEKEYKAHYKYGSVNPHWSISTYYTTHFGFEIENSHIEDELFSNTIYKLDLSLNERFQQREKKKLLYFEGERLFIKGQLTEQQLLDKINLYTLFS